MIFHALEDPKQMSQPCRYEENPVTSFPQDQDDRFLSQLDAGCGFHPPGFMCLCHMEDGRGMGMGMGTSINLEENRVRCVCS